MKRTFSTTFFRRALFLVLLFGGVTNLWGEDKNLPNDGELSFQWSSMGGGHLLGGYTWSSNNMISDGLWEWSREGENDIKMSNKSGINYCVFKGKNTFIAQTRDRYHFDAGTYVFTFYYYFDESGCQYYEPEVKLSTEQRHSDSDDPTASYVNDHSTGAYTKEVEVTLTSAGYYYIRLITGQNNDKAERFGYQKVVIAKAGGGTTYALDLTNDGNGTAVSNQKDDSAISEDTEVTITATPNTGYKFVNWTGFSTETDNPFTFTMTENKNYQANFAQAKQVTITIAAGAHGSVDKNGGTYSEGTQITVTATPETGYEFAQWDDGNTSNPRTITVDESKLSYTASFRKQTKVCTNTLTWEAEDESKIISPTGVTTCEYYKDKHCDGSDASSLLSDASDGHFISMKQSANADSRYIYYHFSTSETANLSFVIRASSKYRDKTGYVTLYSTKQSGSQVFTYEGKSYKKVEEFSQKLGGDVDEKWRDLEHTFSAQPADDYIVAVRSSESWWTMYFDKFTIEASANVFCTEVPTTGYEITKGSHVGGDFTIKADDEDVTEADAGTTITLAVSSTDDCKEFSAWDVYETDDSSNKVTVTNNTFEMPEFDVTVNATFATKTYTISYELGSITSQTITPFDATCGNAWIAPTVNPVYGWRQVAWHKNAIDGEVVTSGVWKPTEATTLYLEWAEDLSTEWGIKGDFNEWDYTRNKFEKKSGEGSSNIGYATVTIENAGYYDFKMRRECASSYDCGCATTIHNSVTNYAFCSNVSNNCQLHAVVPGTYEFRIDFTDYNCPSVDITYPDFYTITFDANGHTTLDPLNDGYAVPGGKVARPTDPRAHNWAFGGWYETPACDGSQFNFNTAINSDKVLYAKWTYSPAQYYYHGAWESWNAETMTLSSDGYYYHIQKAKSNENREFKIQFLDNWYGYQYNHPGELNTDITLMNKEGNSWNVEDNRCAVKHTDGDFYVIAYIPNTPFNTTDAPMICASTYLVMNMGNDHKIFFEATDNGSNKWQTPHFRIGRTNWNSATSMSIVPGTDALYYCTAPTFGKYDAFTIANAAGWTDGNTIYQPSDKKPEGEYAISHEMNYVNTTQRAEDITYVPATTGTSQPDQGCTYYDYTTTKGMKTQQVTNNGGEHGTVTISFVDVVKDFTGNTTVSDFTSGIKLVAQTCKLTITTTPEEGYELATNGLVVTGATLKNSQYVVNGTTTVSATFIPKTYTITLDKNEGPSNGSATATYDNSTLSITHVGARTGYTLSGYFTLAENGVKVINADGTLVINVDGYTDADGKWVKDDNCTLFAQWTINQHTLTWNTNGDELTGDYTHGTVDYGTSITAPNTPTKTGYTFAGWNDGSSVVTPDTTMPDNDVTYTATWNINHYTLTWAGIEGATLKTAGTAAGEVNFGTSLTAPVYEKTGYTFNGWYPEVAATMPAAAATYTAQWTAKQYTITYNNLEGATNPNPTTYTIESETINLQNPGTRTHYTFNGWFSDAQLETPVTTIAQGSTGDKVLYAKWTEDSKYTITFDATTNGGTCSTTSKDIYAGDAIGTLPDATRDNYSMTGWFDAATDGNQITEATIPSGNATYYAQFAVAPLVECTNQKKLECEDAMIPYDKLTIFNSSVAGPKTATFENDGERGEYSGRGYMLTVNEEAGSQIYIPLSISGEEQADLTMQIRYANSQDNYSKIRIYKETQESGDIQVNNTTYYTRFVSEEFASSGWTTNFTTATYHKTLDPGNYIIGLWAKNDARFDYIDISTTNDVLCTTTPRYELKLEINDPEKGENAIGAGAYTEGALAPINVTAKSGYEFVAWKKGETLVSTDASFNYTMPAENVTLTAYFDTEATKRTLTVNAGDHGSVSPTSQQVGEGREVTITATPADGYLFDKWTSTDVDLTGDDTDNPLTITMPTKDVTLTATWKVNYCKPYLQLNCVDYDESKVTIHNADGKASIETHDTYATITSGGAIYLPVTLPAGTYYIKVSGRNNSSSVWLNYFTQTGSQDDVTYDGKYYHKTDYKDVGSFGNDFSSKSWDGISLSGGSYLFSITGVDGADFQWIRIYNSDDEPFCPTMYTVTFTQPTEGQGTVTAQIKNGDAISSGEEVPEGTQVIFTWNEASGYDFVKFNDGTTDYTQNPCTLTVNSNLTVTTTVEVEVTKHLLTVNAGEHGSVSPTSKQVGEGREVTITATPESHYGFASWTATGITLTEAQQKQNPLTITMPTNDVTLTASFEYVYVDAMIVTGNSAVTGGESSGSGGTVTPTSVADPNRFFDHNVWEMSYTMPSGGYAGIHINCDAGYTPASSNGATGFGFYYKTEPGQTIAFCLDPRGQQSDQRKTQLPSTNGFWKYAFVESNLASNWEHSYIIIYQNATDNASGTWTPSTLPGSGGTTTTPSTGKYYIAEICATERTTKPEETPVYTATFVANPSDKATVTATVDAAAITSGDAVDAGKSITFDYSNVDANYRFTGWTATGISLTDEQKQEHPLTITMPSASISLTANFVRVYTLVVGKDANIASVTGEGQYAAGESVTVTATATQGYKFTKWTAGAGGSELATTSSYTFDMPATDNYTVYANSEQDNVTYHITLGECTNGSISAKVNDQEYTGGELDANTPVVLTATPNEGYGFVKWIDGSREKTHTIYANAETQAITWTAEFAVRHTVTATFGKPGDHVTGGGEYATGAQVTLEAFVSDKDYELDYNFSHWEQVSGTAPITEHEHDNPLTFIMPAQNLTLKAIYAPVECVDTFVIQCEDDQAYIPYNTQGSDLTTYPHEIPHVDGCGRHSDYYTKYHGTGYYDYREAESAEMYYPIDLPASTYKFEMWSATNDDKDCWMNLYIESDDANPEVVYKEVSYKKTNSVKADNYGADRWPFAISGTIENVVITSPKSVIIGLYCGRNFGAFDQIKITATDNGEPNYVFCHELSTDLFVIKEGETKEIPVCGVKNLIIYDGGQANNEEDVEASVSIKHVRQVKKLDIWEDFAVPYTATSIQVEDPDDHNMYDIYPAVLNYSGDIENGYFYMQELKHEEMATVTGIEFRQRWQNTTKEKPQANTPYIIEFTSTQSDGYFENTYITYGKTGSTEVRGYDNATVDHGSWPTDGTKPTYHYVANNSVVPVYPYDAYVLNEDHTEFVLTEQPEILPFHCYIQASAEMKAMAPRLRLVGGGSTPTLIPVVEALNVDAEGVFKFIMDDKVYILRNGVLYNAVGQHVK